MIDYFFLEQNCIEVSEFTTKNTILQKIWAQRDDRTPADWEKELEDADNV